MKTLAITTLLMFFVIGFIQVNPTDAYFSDSSKSLGNTITAGCWSGPEVPKLIFPDNNYVATSTSAWYLNPYMDWSDSWVCPSKTVTYEYESYRDGSLTNLAYRSGMLSESKIPAIGTPDGSYYWRVRAYDGDTWSDWSSVWLLIVDSKKLKPILPAFVQLNTGNVDTNKSNEDNSVTVPPLENVNDQDVVNNPGEITDLPKELAPEVISPEDKKSDEPTEPPVEVPVQPPVEPPVDEKLDTNTNNTQVNTPPTNLNCETEACD